MLSHDDRNNVIWRSHPSLNVILVEIVAKAVYNCNHNYFFSSRSGETLFNLNEAYERLQNWAICRDFAMVQRSKETGNAARGTFVRVKWQCIYHGEKTAKERVTAIKAALTTEKAAEKAAVAAAKTIKNKRIKKAQEIAKIDQKEAKIVKRAKKALQNAMEVVILLILFNNPIWN